MTEPIKTGVAIPEHPMCEKCGNPQRKDRKGWPIQYCGKPCPPQTNEQPKATLFAGYNPPHGAVCVDVKDITKNKTTIEPPGPVEQPNQNIMLIEQVKGCVKVAVGFLGQLKPKTDSVDGCIYKLKEWQDDYLRILQKAFE